MRIDNSAVTRILDNAHVEFGGIHDRNGHGFMAVYRIDHHKITFNVPSEKPRQSTLNSLLFKELSKRLREIDLALDVSWSNSCRETYVYDPWSLMPLVKTYLFNQYLDLPYKKKEA